MTPKPDPLTTQMQLQLTPLERYGLGVAVLLTATLPAAAVLALLLVAIIGAAVPNWLFAAGFLTYIICAGLQLPIYLVVGEIVGDRLPESQRPSLWQSWRSPFWLIRLWWRYIR